MTTPPPDDPPPGPPAPRQRRRAKITVGIALPVLAGLTIAVIALSPGPSAPTGEWKVGQCVTPAGRVGDQDRVTVRRTRCDAKAAAAKVTKMTTYRLFIAQVACPEDTDALVRVDPNNPLAEDVACIRNLKAPHPGDTGQGGGLFRPGDCILDPDPRWGTVKETPCAGAHWATVVRWTEDFESCREGGSYDGVRMPMSRNGLCVRTS